jgi:predicted ATPase/class 3 adenylate cyclase
MAEMVTPHFGDLLRHHRQIAGLTQAELAERAGLSVRGINDLERGVRQAPRKDTVALLAAALGLSDAERAAFAAAGRHALGPPTPSTAPPITEPALPTGTVTFLFTDIEDSAQLLQQVGVARYAQVRAEHQRLLRAAVAAHGGHEVDSQRDSCFLVFATAPDAVTAAAEAQRALATHPWPEGVSVRVRMGLYTGTAQLAGDHYIGLEVHRAARIAAAGRGGQVLLSEAARVLAEPELPEGTTLRDLGAYRLKDLQRPEHLWQLVLPNGLGLPADFPPLRTLDAHPHNLPIQPTPLIGREQEVAAVVALLRRENVRLVTLTGTGGVGKTRLALQVAAELNDSFADGVWLVRLSRLTDPGLVLPTIARTLGLQEVGSRPIEQLLRAHLRARQLLLLLDNCEQVAAAAPEVADLLQAGPHLTVLATSRVALHLRGEKQVQVRPLPLPDPIHLPPPQHLVRNAAVALFVQRAQDADAAFALTNATALAIAAICARLDGLPLAIELAAARTRLLPPSVLLQRLERRLPLLVGGARDMEDRQQTMRDTLAWSEDLLQPEEQRLFRRLSVFVGGFTLEAAEAVCAAPEGAEPLGVDVLEGLEQLVDQSLVQQQTVDEEGSGEARFRLLYVVREYALERLEASGEGEGVQRQHVAFFLAMAEDTDLKLRSTEQSSWRRRLEAEHDNLRTALHWTLEHQEAELGLRLAGALLIFWRYCNHEREGRNWCEKVLAQPGASVRTPARARALRAAGAMAYFQGDFPEAQRLLEESVSTGREVGEEGKRSLAHALELLGNVALWQGNPGAARELAGESLQVYEEIGEPWGIAMALCLLGTATGELDDLATACSLLEESAARLRVVGDTQRLALPLNALGLVALRRGDYAAARTRFEEALAVARETEDEQYTTDALAHLGTITFRMGEYHESFSFYKQSLESHALNREQGTRGDSIIEDLAGLAAIASLFGQLERAARLLGAAAALRETIGTPQPKVERQDTEEAVAAVRAALGEEAWAAAHAAGQALTLEEAIAEALEETTGR